MLLALTSQVTVDFFHPLEEHICSVTDMANGHDSLHADVDCLACSVVIGSAQPAMTIRLEGAQLISFPVYLLPKSSPVMKQDGGQIESRGPPAGLA